jgi:S1-C subfamily serine protease
VQREIIMSHAIAWKPAALLGAVLLGILSLTAPVSAQSGPPSMLAPSSPSDQRASFYLTSRGWYVRALGVELRPVSRGLRVVWLSEGGPAERVGLEVGDVLVSLNGSPLRDMDDLRDALQDAFGYARLRVIDVRTGRIAYRNASLTR